MAQAHQTLIEMYCLIVFIDLLLGVLQEDPGRWPRRLTHLLTEPVLSALRRVVGRGSVDLSPAVLILMLTAIKWGTA